MPLTPEVRESLKGEIEHLQLQSQLVAEKIRLIRRVLRQDVHPTCCPIVLRAAPEPRSR